MMIRVSTGGYVLWEGTHPKARKGLRHDLYLSGLEELEACHESIKACYFIICSNGFG